MYGYNIETEKPKEIAKMKTKRSNHGSCIFKNNNENFLLVAGGNSNSNHDYILCEFLNFNKNEWQSLPDLQHRGSYYQYIDCANWNDYNSILTFYRVSTGACTLDKKQKNKKKTNNLMQNILRLSFIFFIFFGLQMLAAGFGCATTR